MTSPLNIKHLSTVFGIFTMAFLTACHTPTSDAFPTPSDTIVVSKTDEDELKEQLEKEEFFKFLHYAAPDVDVEAVDERYRRNFHQNQYKNSYLADSLVIGEWFEKGSKNLAGRTIICDYDPASELILMLSDGGALYTNYRSDWQNMNWVPVNDQMKFSSPRGVKIIDSSWVVAYNKGVALSTDSGTTWTYATGLEAVNSWGNIAEMMVSNDSNRTIYILLQQWDYDNWGSDVALYSSIDTAQTFQLVQRFRQQANGVGNLNSADLYMHPFDTNGYLSIKDSVYKVKGQQVTGQFSMPNTIASDAPRILASSKIQDKDFFYVYSDGTVYTTFDSIPTDSTWNLWHTQVSYTFSRNSFTANLTDSMYYVGGIDVYIGQSNALTIRNDWWQYYGDMDAYFHADIPSFQSFIQSDSSQFHIINTDGGAYISYDNEFQTIHNISLENLNISQYYSTYTNPDEPEWIYAGAQDQGFQRTDSGTNGVANFVQTISGDYSRLCSGDRGQSLWYLYPGFVAFVADAQGNWSTNTMDFNGINDLWLPPMTADFNDPNKAYFAGNYNGRPAVYHLQNTGTTVTSTVLADDFDLNGANQLTSIATRSNLPNHVYVLDDNGRFWYSHDQGQSFQSSTSNNLPTGHYFHGTSIHPSRQDSNTIYIAGSGYSNPAVYKSTDGGNNFSSMDNGLPNTLVYQITGMKNDSLLFAATEVGPYVYVTSENRWYSMADSIAPNQVYWSVEFVDTTLTARFGTYGRGIWDFVLEGPTDTNSVNNVGMNSTPTFYPNPTQGSLTVSYQFQEEELTTIQFYNLNGQLVKSVQNEHFIDLSGLTNGIYIMVVQNKNKVYTERVVKTN